MSRDVRLPTPSLSRFPSRRRTLPTRPRARRRRPGRQGIRAEGAGDPGRDLDHVSQQRQRPPSRVFVFRRRSDSNCRSTRACPPSPFCSTSPASSSGLQHSRLDDRIRLRFRVASLREDRKGRSCQPDGPAAARVPRSRVASADGSPGGIDAQERRGDGGTAGKRRMDDQGEAGSAGAPRPFVRPRRALLTRGRASGSNDPERWRARQESNL